MNTPRNPSMDSSSRVVKGKRTKRPRQSCLPGTVAGNSSSEEQLAESPTAPVAERTTTSVTAQFSNSAEDEDLANCLILLARSGGPERRRKAFMASDRKGRFVSKRAPDSFECQTCKKCFPSFQALGGHRTSHKKPLTTTDGIHGLVSGNKVAGTTAMAHQQQQQVEAKQESKGKMHQCGICGSEFSSGQALGGHMRRHRVISEPVLPATDSEKKPDSMMPSLSVDLNLPADPGDYSDNFAHFRHVSDFINQPPVVFPTLVDCHQ